MQENADNKLSYQGDMADGYSVYHMLVNGKVVMEVKVSKDEEGMPIYIKKADSQLLAFLGWTKTTSRAFTVEDGSRISAMTMKEAVYGNLVFFLIDLLYA